MDQKIRTAGGRITGVIAIFCGLLTFPLSLAVIMSKPAEIWWLGLVLLICSVMMLYGGIQSLVAAKKEKKFSDMQQQLIEKETRGLQNETMASANQPPEKIILARWIYSTDEWQQFMAGEKKERKTSLIIEVVLIALLGGMLIHYSRSESWIISFAFSIPLALLIGLLRYKFTLSSVSLSGKKMPEVIITADAVMVNGHYNRFYGDNLWLGKVDVKDTGKMNILEITYCWNTRSGQSSEEIRVPVPKGKIREAIEVQEKLMAERN